MFSCSIPVFLPVGSCISLSLFTPALDLWLLCLCHGAYFSQNICFRFTVPRDGSHSVMCIFLYRCSQQLCLTVHFNHLYLGHFIEYWALLNIRISSQLKSPREFFKHCQWRTTASLIMRQSQRLWSMCLIRHQGWGALPSALLSTIILVIFMKHSTLYLQPPILHPTALKVLPTANLPGSTIRLSEHRFIVSHTSDSTSFLRLFVMLMVPRGFQPLHLCLPSPRPLKRGSHVTCFNHCLLWKQHHSTTLFPDMCRRSDVRSLCVKRLSEEGEARRRNPSEQMF